METMLNTSSGVQGTARSRRPPHINVALVNEAIAEFHLIVSAVRNTELVLKFDLPAAEIANVDFVTLAPALREKLEAIRTMLPGISSVSVG